MTSVSARRIRSLRAATAFVDRTGIALVFPSDDLVLPSLWEAVVGTTALTVFRTDEQGKRVLTDELDRVWSLKDRLGEERLACVGKHVRGRLALVSLELLPALYALTGRPGHPDDFRAPGLLSPLELELAEALLAAGPQTGPELRRLVGVFDAKGTKRALEGLQRLLVVTQAGEAEQEHGWGASIFDLVARRYRERLGRLPTAEDARTELAAAVLRSAGEVSAADVAAVLGVSRGEAAAALDRLAGERRARRREEEDFILWTSVRRR